jgi:hypothetical protein
MHQVIGIIVRVEDSEDMLEGDVQREAVSSAKQHFQDWLHLDCVYGEGGPWDYCTPMVDEEGSGVSGTDRYDSYEDDPPAYKLDSQQGKIEMYECWKHTVKEFRKAYDRVEEVVNGDYNLIELMNDRIENEDDSKDHEYDSLDFIFKCESLANRHSPSPECYLYWACKYDDGSGSPVAQPKVFKDLRQADWEDLYIVPMDVHY